MPHIHSTNQSALLLVSIGPVQEFIAEARKIRDLWMGSHLLSRLSLKVIDAIGRSNIIFPSLAASGSVDSVPNQFCALVEWDNLNNLATKMDEIRSAFLKTLGETTHTKLKDALSSLYSSWDALWDAQLQDHFSLVWVARKVSADDLATGYGETFRRLQQQLDMRKATRTFAQWQGNHAEKCYQCGHRELLGPEDRVHNVNFWKDAQKVPPLRGSFREKERLCAVCLIKRVHTPPGGKKVFDSTSDLAVAPYRKQLDELPDTVTEPFVTAIKNLYKALGKAEATSVADINGDFFYREALRKESILKEYQPETSKQSEVEALAAEADNALAALYTHSGKPSKYLAIMMLDADKMGEFMSGKEIPVGETFSPDWQREQSGRLLNLSQTVYPPLIEAWGGMLVYSGGDDLMALGPLKGALETIAGINDTFVKAFPTRSLSGTLVIAHHQDSLRWGIEEARRSLELAKEAHGRNALVVSLRLSSGTTLTCGAKWQPAHAPHTLRELYDHLTRWLATDDKGLAPSFLYDVQRDFRVFYDRLGNLHKEMFTAETGRFLHRHIPKTSPLMDESHDTDKKRWEAILESIVELAVSPNRPKYDVQDNFESFLKIAAFLGRERKGGN